MTDADVADYTDAPVMTILQYGEVIGTLVKHNLFSRELADDWLWWEGLWARVGPAALPARAARRAAPVRALRGTRRRCLA
jgi:hypothetical protein